MLFSERKLKDPIAISTIRTNCYSCKYEQAVTAVMLFQVVDWPFISTVHMDSIEIDQWPKNRTKIKYL